MGSDRWLRGRKRERRQAVNDRRDERRFRNDTLVRLQVLEKKEEEAVRKTREEKEKARQEEEVRQRLMLEMKVRRELEDNH